MLIADKSISANLLLIHSYGSSQRIRTKHVTTKLYPGLVTYDWSIRQRMPFFLSISPTNLPHATDTTHCLSYEQLMQRNTELD